MLEIIGGIVVALIVWIIIKRILVGLTALTIRRSIQHAVKMGVPYGFASACFDNRTILNASLNTCAKTDPEFREKDVYIQYGESIYVLYTASIESENRGEMQSA